MSNNEDRMFNRNSHGIIKIEAIDKNDFAYKQGKTHAKDRQIQLMLTRLVAQGRLSECLKASDETLEIDIFMRSMQLTKGTKEEVKILKSPERDFLQSYCDGINHFIKNNRRPFEFIITGYKPELWTIEDSLIITKIMSYMGLAQSQEDIEKIIIDQISAGVSLEKLKSLYSPHLDNLGSEVIDKIKQIKEYHSLTPKEIRFSKLIPKFIASNNWVISSKLTKNKSALQCNDPHLEANRLPAVWYETQATISNNFLAGVTMPGIPGLLMGRNSHISYGFTYGFMDLIDFFIEDISKNECQRINQNSKIDTVKEVILRKNMSAHEIYIHRSNMGRIEVDSQIKELEDGVYLCRAWSGELAGSLNSLISSYRLIDCKSSKDFCDIIKNVTISCNWLVSDQEDNIAYQQSGPLPIRYSSGLYPLLAYDERNHWKGLHDTSKLGHIFNPERGYLATANQQMTFENLPLSINMPMGNYRYERIKDLINQNKNLNDIQLMKEMQSDLYSKQAEVYLKEILPLLDNKTFKKELLSWNLCYDKKSKGAVVFEEFYKEFLKLIFTNDYLSVEMWDHLTSNTNILIDSFDNFDKIILSDDTHIEKLWFGDISKKDFVNRAAAAAQKNLAEEKLKNKTWGDLRKMTMTNIFFAGKLPKFLKIDHGPIIVEGNRATIVQGQVFSLDGRSTSFCPSYRYICDLKEDHIYTVLAGGVSDRPFSKLYKNNIQKWLNFEYKELKLP